MEVSVDVLEGIHFLEVSAEACEGGDQELCGVEVVFPSHVGTNTLTHISHLITAWTGREEQKIREEIW